MGLIDGGAVVTGALGKMTLFLSDAYPLAIVMGGLAVAAALAGIVGSLMRRD